MKKLVILATAVVMLSVSCVTTFAASSPEIDVEKATGRHHRSESRGESGVVLSTTSAKTGVTADPAVFAALGVVACGGIAVVAKKKMKA